MTKVKLQEIAKVITGLPLQRYIGKDDSIKQKVILNIPFMEKNNEIETIEEDVSKNMKEQFYSKKHDIIYKVQQTSFAKEITNETDAIISNNFIIIRVDEERVNPTFLTYYLNDPRVDYEIQRKIDSTKIMKVSTKILKNLTISLPPKEEQDLKVRLITLINKRIELKNKSIEYDKELINSLYDETIGDTYEIT